ncbi:hypothetical protein SM11_pC1093 (plasmid) [Sinorhizobium meliloti SM11]|uniref:Uncharacterized protein n=1 Tax=Sinorhizobium meliloti (strain SM11) TaxID=707241 RepID=F7XF41_SINMM|nr:hypothetical protein SM11_pC1093 [Sinorhizobium meliloti SM11]
MQGHSTHIGEYVTIHYPHHPLFGKRVRRQGVDHRKGGAVAHIETTPGNVIVIPTWMLDPIACAGMEIGEPRASLEALIELASLLTPQGERAPSSTAKAVDEEVPDETANANSTRGSAPDDHGVRLGEDAWDEPAPKGSRTDGIGHVVDGGGLCSGEGGAA